MGSLKVEDEMRDWNQGKGRTACWSQLRVFISSAEESWQLDGYMVKMSEYCGGGRERHTF
jgi:hypothetical protein